MPVWHVSVARVTSNRRAIKPVALWVPSEVKDAAIIAVKSLDGVGDKTRHWHERSEQAIHVRRQLTQPEVDLLWRLRPECPVFSAGMARPSGG